MPKYADRQQLIRESADQYRSKVTPERVAQGLQHYGIQPGATFRTSLTQGITRVTQNWEDRWFDRWVTGVQR